MSELNVMKSNVNQPIVGVGIMLIDSENRVLLGHRIKENEKPSWCFPGGKIEAHESLQQSAARELFEETNLSVDPNQLIPFVSFIDRQNVGVNLTTGLYIKLNSDEIKQYLKVTEPHIFECWKWVGLNELPENIFFASKVMLDFWCKRQIDSQYSIYTIQSI